MKGELLKSGKIVAESPYYDISDYVDKDLIEIIN